MEVLFIGSSLLSINTLLKKAQVNGELATLSKCPTHPALEGRFEIAGRGNAHRVERKNTTRTIVYLKALLEAFILMLKPERLWQCYFKFNYETKSFMSSF